MGNLRSVGKALEHVGAEPVLTADHARVREARGIVLPAWARCRRRWSACASWRSTGCCASGSRRASRDRALHGDAASVRVHHRAGRGGGDRAAARAVEALDAPGLKVPQIGWNPVSWRRESPLTESLPSPCAFYHANSFAPRPAEPTPCSAPPSTAPSSSVWWSGRRLRPPVAPREVGAGRAAPAEELRVAGRPRAVDDPPPGGGHPRRQGGAARQGRFEDETVYADDPLEAARSFVEAGATSSTSWTWTARARASP